MNACAPIVLVLGLASCAIGQSAIVRVTHNAVKGTVAPGETVQITTTITWQAPGQSALFAIGGGVQATPDIGTASSNVFPYGPLPGISTINPGTPALGSVHGVYLEYGDLNWWLFGQPPAAPWSFRLGFEVVRFDWTAPGEPGVVAFDWNPSAALPQPLIASSLWGNPIVQPVSTTYFGTSLTVIPAPPSAAPLLLAAPLLAKRRTRLLRPVAAP